jgi:hypothetical protein
MSTNTNSVALAQSSEPASSYAGASKKTLPVSELGMFWAPHSNQREINYREAVWQFKLTQME